MPIREKQPYSWNTIILDSSHGSFQWNNYKNDYEKVPNTEEK